MKKTVIIYGSSTGTCEDLAGRIGTRLGVDDVIGERCSRRQALLYLLGAGAEGGAMSSASVTSTTAS
mgnify:CR=1 FL=1